MAAARELYATRGSRGTTTREVADRAGVNEATLFRHFGTKVQLLAAMLEHYSTYSAMPEILARATGLATIEDQLRSLAADTIEEMKGREDLIRVSMAEELANPEGLSCAWRAPSEARKMLVAWFEERVRTGDLSGESEWLARVFMSLLFSFVMARKIWAGIDLTRERSVANLVEIFLNGARAR
ncbi:MAG: helix-turn-helix transcriptional regulator [Candidatus Eremiobacteraeota bacterium]|nr:helix-turn-helix transcriptional regulator [Candidatus Eremiobacteraeota bacterium]